MGGSGRDGRHDAGFLLPVEGIGLLDALALYGRGEHVHERVVVGRVLVLDLLYVLEEELELAGQVLEELRVIVLVLHEAHLLLVLDLAPRQLTGEELDDHVEERPEVVVAAHLLVLVRVDRRVAHGAAEAGLRASGAHLALRVRVLAREAEVEHEDFARVCRHAAHGEVGGLDVAVEEADGVNVPDGDEYLRAEAERGAQREALLGLGAPQLGQILALQRHHHVVEVLGGAAADEAAHVVFALQATQHGHLHLEHLLGLLGRLELERHLLLGVQVDGVVDLAEAAAAYLAQHLPSLLDQLIRLQ